MTDRGALQPHEPELLRRIAVEEAKERAARFVGTYEYDGPRWKWLVGTR